MCQQFIPSNFALRKSGHAPQHAAQRRLDAGSDLVVAITRRDAVDKGALLVAIGKGQVIAECAVGRKLARAR